LLLFHQHQSLVSMIKTVLLPGFQKGRDKDSC
jgi:hypothetical protein